MYWEESHRALSVDDVTSSTELHDIPWMDGSAVVLRRDATKVRVFDGFFPGALDRNGVFGFYWDPDENVNIAKCAYPIDSWTERRVQELTDEPQMDRCAKIVNTEGDPCPPPELVMSIESFMCDNNLGDSGPSCIQKMFQAKKANAEEYNGFFHQCPDITTPVMDCTHSEVVIERYFHHAKTNQDSPRATGWLWAHNGPSLKSQTDISEDIYLTELLCGLYFWNAEKWQPSGMGLKQPKYMLQMITMTGFAGDKSADEIFDLINLEQLCLYM